MKIDIYIKVGETLEHRAVVHASRDAVTKFIEGRLDEDFDQCEECLEWYTVTDECAIDETAYMLCAECAKTLRAAPA